MLETLSPIANRSALNEVNELSIMLDAVGAFAEKFGTDGQTAVAWEAIFADPHADHMPPGCVWMFDNSDVGDLETTVWGDTSKKKIAPILWIYLLS